MLLSLYGTVQKKFFNGILITFFKFYFMGMFVLLDCVYVHSLYVLYLRRPDEGIEFPGTGVIGCEQPYGCWESNSPLSSKQ